MAVHQLDGLDLASLHGQPRRRVALSDGVVAIPRGRNAVWQLDFATDAQAFVTCCRSDDDFSRRLFGLKVAAALARADDRFTAAVIERADPDERVIVTRAIGGESLNDVFVQAFRHDKNPLDLRKLRARARQWVDLALAWLKAFNSAADSRPDTLYDHSTSGSWSRSCRRLESAAFKGFTRLQEIPQRYRSRVDDAESVLVMGDATLGNFWVHGERIGVVDFEDVGVGAGWRDEAQLAAAVRWALHHPLYAADSELQQRMGRLRTTLHAFTELELLVNRFVAAAPTAKFLELRRIAAAIERAFADLTAGGHVVDRPLAMTTDDRAH